MVSSKARYMHVHIMFDEHNEAHSVNYNSVVAVLLQKCKYICLH